ncbi:epidermal growth factor receptor kinase substrate 8-like protein 3 isoform X1 [Poecilia formosa]|uniref:epidermal growth factor receptor kinase substrate 8-like protein 3 isoform X1 n=2 Tax=Poecilia formosa TaxID=48698 RepID=UPI000443B769|nr:PREDICTED: epidermal growth factor receptor kinase substrate 8-like protein 3 isoform X1 [Poecilia formosa]
MLCVIRQVCQDRMFRSNSPYGSETGSYISFQSNGFSNMDDSASQISNISRPSAKSIYLQRLQYAASMNKMMEEKSEHRVEHLFTCDLNGRDLRNIHDCVERLQFLDQTGHIWGQNMVLEVRGANLLLTDYETKEELESFSAGEMKELLAFLDAGVFDSLLILSVQNRRKPATTIFLFQCDEVRADFIAKDLVRALSQKSEGSHLSSNGHTVGRHERVKQPNKPAEPRPVHEAPPWSPPDNAEDDFPEPELDLRRYGEEDDVPPPMPSPSPPPRPYTELDRNVDILNHIVTDVEIFMGKISAAEAKSGKKKKKKKKGKGGDGMPPEEEFSDCLHKIKSGFNLLGELNGKINNPAAPDFVHSLFSALAFVCSHCSEAIPPSIVAPLLTPQCIRLLSEEASSEEDNLWQSLGDAWNIPSTKWPEEDEDIPVYNMQFFDGWQPPEVTGELPPSEPESRRERPRQESPRRESPRRESPRRESPRPPPSLQPPPNTAGHKAQEEPTYAKWRPPKERQKPPPVEVKLCDMRVKYDFISRNQRELTVTKGEIVDLLDKSKKWWKVRNNRGEEGYVPNNVLEDVDAQSYEDFDTSPVLTRKSKPPEVKAWLEHMGFNPITVRCLGVLSGSMLLGMSREELKSVCPEEGGRVFFQLQAVRSALVDAS